MPDRGAGGRRRGRLSSCLALVMASLAAGHAQPASAQVSPGPLARAHAAFDGTLGCARCHGKGEGEMDRRCLACHGEIASLVSSHRGFHGREGTKDCARCHPDHGGRDFALIAWPGKSPEKFDHARAGWALRGKHAAVACAKCHTRAHTSTEMAGLLKTKRDVTWVGIDAGCRTCHEDPHRGGLGDDCAGCHSEEGWRPVPRFDHAKTAYPLTGLHAQVACAKCHEAERLNLARDDRGRAAPLYKPLPHDECSACHADPHKGAFGAACGSCHVTRGFRVIDKARFDHDRTRYPLRGKHAGLACGKCHDEKTAWGKKPPFASCGGCHKDPHAAQGVLAGKPADCSACHTVGDFKPSSFSVTSHARTAFPLEGAHARVACMNCHGRKPAGKPAAVSAALGPANVWMHPTHGRCADCHRDPHAGRFSPGGERARSNDCLACHTMDALRPSTFDAAAHGTAAFRLEGAHRAVPCVMCHPELGAEAAASRATLTMKNDARKCAQCHQSAHGTQFDSRKDGGACDACHDSNAFRPATRFDHDKVKSFKLEGAHRKVACERCHPMVTTRDGKTMMLYRPLSSRCESCHAEGDILQKRN